MKLTLDSDGHWYIGIACDGVVVKPPPATGRTVGVDLGLITFAATSDGEMFSNPRAAAFARLRTERAARRLSRRKKGSHRRRKARVLLAKHHAHVANIRRESHITVARALVSRYDTIFVEELNVKGLARSALAKSVNDAAWGNFGHWLRVKAEEAAREVIEVDPRGTSQNCSRCGCVAVEKLSLAVRTFRCGECGFMIDRDVNAAVNIKGAGMALRREAPRSKRTSATRETRLGLSSV
jgi:putative transposase